MFFQAFLLKDLFDEKQYVIPEKNRHFSYVQLPTTFVYVMNILFPCYFYFSSFVSWKMRKIIMKEKNQRIYL